MQGNIRLQISFAQNRLEMLADIIEREEDIDSERVLEILKADTGVDLVSRLGIVFPDWLYALPSRRNPPACAACP